MTLTLFSEDVEFLKELYYKNRLDLYFFHEKYRLSPAQLARTIRKFEELDLIVLSCDQVILLDKGRSWIFANRKNIFLKEKSKYWKVIPVKMCQKVLGVNELYKPNRKKIDKELFENTEDGK